MEGKQEQIIKDLLEEIKQELFHYPKTTKKQEIKYVLKRVLRPGNTPQKDAFFWPHAMLTQTLEEAGDVELLKKYYDMWIKKGQPIFHVDNIMNGYSLLYVYDKTKEDKYKAAADRLWKYLCEYEKELGSPLPYRKNHPTHVYVDALGMTVPFLCRYGAMFGVPEATKMGTKQIMDFLQYGMDTHTGLPYHGYDAKNAVKQGIIGWGRAVGWLMLSMADSMESLPEGEEKEKLITAFYKLTLSAYKYIREDGYFSWQLSAMESEKDTSATAMIAYAVGKMKRYKAHTYIQRKESLTEKNADSKAAFGNEKQCLSIEEMLEKNRQALFRSCRNHSIYDCSGECEGFSRYPQIYGAYPWSLGPGVRFFLMEKQREMKSDCKKGL